MRKGVINVALRHPEGWLPHAVLVLFKGTRAGLPLHNTFQPRTLLLTISSAVRDAPTHVRHTSPTF